MILLKLEDFDLIREIWQHLLINDIINLLSTSVNVRNMSLRVNRFVSQDIDIHLKESDEENRQKTLNNILQLFPNIEILKLSTSYSFLGSGLGMSLSVLYDYRSPLRRSLKVFDVSISCDKGLSGCKMTKNINNITIAIYL